MVLRPYQNEFLENIRVQFRLGKNRVLGVSPTGSGKTVIFSFMCSEAVKRNLRVMVLAHRSEILDQIVDCLRKFDMNPGEIRAGQPFDRTNPILVASVQTLVRRFDRVIPPDLIVIDEASHSAAPQWVKVFAQYPKAKYVGVTATPERLDGRGLGEYYGAMVLGPSTEWLMSEGYLKRPIYYGPKQAPDLSSLKKLGGDYNKEQSSEVMDKNTITGDAVAHYVKYGRGMPAIAFCVTLEHARHVAAQFNSSGISSEVIEGSMTPELRRQAKGRLENGSTRVMVSCELVSEGFDLPAVGCSVLLRPTASLALHLQQLGRSLRPFVGQDGAVILDHAGNTLRHGMAEEPRDWSLEGKAGKRRPKEVSIETRQCVKCYAIFQGKQCPQCKSVVEGGGREVKAVDGELTQLTPEMVAQREARKVPLWNDTSRCRTFEDYLAVQRKRGFKNGWAVFRWKASREYRRLQNGKPKVQELIPEVAA